MVTYSAPIRRGEQLVGVLTLDLSVQYFKVLGDWLKEVNLGRGSYGFVVSPSGIIISHPDPEFDLSHLVAAGKKPKNILGLSLADKRFANLVNKMHSDSSGSGTAIDPSTGKDAVFLFAHVPSAEWTFVAVIPNADQ